MRVSLAGVAAAVVVAVGCGDAGGTPDAAAAPDAPGCAPIWTVDAAAGSSATIAAGALTLRGVDLDGSAVEVYRDGLAGDFDVGFVVDAFVAGGVGAFLQAAIAAPVAQPTRILTTAIGTHPAIGVSAADQPGGTTSIEATASTAATLRFVRVGATVTLTATAGATVATVTAPDFAIEPLRVGVQLGSNLGVVGPESIATLGAFQVAGGAGVTADAFDCDSLVP